MLMSNCPASNLPYCWNYWLLFLAWIFHPCVLVISEQAAFLSVKLQTVQTIAYRVEGVWRIMLFFGDDAYLCLLLWPLCYWILYRSPKRAYSHFISMYTMLFPFRGILSTTYETWNWGSCYMLASANGAIFCSSKDMDGKYIDNDWVM
jgi:hypothetical protein